MSENKIPVSFGLFNIHWPSYIAADDLELRLLLNNEDFLSRSEIDTLITSEDNEDKENNEDENEYNHEKIDRMWNQAWSHFLIRSKSSSILF